MDDTTRKLIEDVRRAAGITSFDELQKLMSNRSELERVAELIAQQSGPRELLQKLTEQESVAAQMKQFLEQDSVAAQFRKLAEQDTLAAQTKKFLEQDSVAAQLKKIAEQDSLAAQMEKLVGQDSVAAQLQKIAEQDSLAAQMEKLVGQDSVAAQMKELAAQDSLAAQVKKLAEQESLVAQAGQMFESSRTAELNRMNNVFMPPLDAVLVPHIPDAPGKVTHDRLISYIKDFEEELDAEHEIGARLVSFGQSVTFHIENIGYWGDMVCFYGRDESGQALQLVQHYTQLSVLLIAVKKQGEKPRRIGFITGDEK